MGILEEKRLGMKISVTRSDLRVGQDEGSKVEIVWACEEKKCRCPVSKCERLTMTDIMRGRGSSKKYKEHLELTKDMILDRRVWRSHIRIKG